MVTKRQQVLGLPVKRTEDWMSSELIIAHSFLLFFTPAVNDGFELYLPSFHFQDLIKDLNSELSGDFRKLVMITLKTPAELDASELHDAIKVHS